MDSIFYIKYNSKEYNIPLSEILEYSKNNLDKILSSDLFRFFGKAISQISNIPLKRVIKELRKPLYTIKVYTQYGEGYLRVSKLLHLIFEVSLDFPKSFSELLLNIHYKRKNYPNFGNIFRDLTYLLAYFIPTLVRENKLPIILNSVYLYNNKVRNPIKGEITLRIILSGFDEYSTEILWSFIQKYCPSNYSFCDLLENTYPTYYWSYIYKKWLRKYGNGIIKFGYLTL